VYSVARPDSTPFIAAAPGDFRGVVGVPEKPDLKIGVKKISIHPKFKKGDFSNDIAVLQLSEGVGPPFVRLLGLYPPLLK
jgi:hypothetical protein